MIYTPEEWEAFVGGVRDGELDLSILADDARNATRPRASSRLLSNPTFRQHVWTSQWTLWPVVLSSLLESS
ncbi:hypothetical protein GCM10029992_21760 [Glycomyces albus]